ncbi:MAG: hypothetical protein EXQ96_05055 [Alphaproteobacteria bacterium]|nr:hypothetical protein [Alphaproteobacteria bacterium]
MEHATGPAWAILIEHSALGHLIRGSVWVYPAANVAHVVAVAVLVGAIIVFDLALLGLTRDIAPVRLARLCLPVARVAFAVAVPTGVVMFTAEASFIIQNPVFLIKLGMIAAALVNIVAAHAGPFRAIGTWGWAVGTVPGTARTTALLSLVLWPAVMIAGRLIAYF